MGDAEPQANNEELLRLLFQQTQEQVVVLLDPKGHIVGWFPAAEETFGYLPHEVLGQPVSILFTPEDLEAGLDEYERSVATKDIEAEDDRWMLRKDGARFWATGVLAPIRDSGGQLLGFGKVLRNRTDFRAKTEALEARIEQLEAANQRKNEFIIRLAHELRNPLAGVAQSVELLKFGGNDSSAVPILEREIAAMRRMIDDLLDMTRASTGKVQLNKQRVDLRQLVESSIEACRPNIDSQTQTLHIITVDTPIWVEADPDRMRQVFVNLIQNAAKFTQNGGTIWLKVSIEANESVVKVEDNGIGISPDVLPHIFELFTQAELLPERTVGLGIGLSVVKDLTQLHGGSVQVRSDGIGKGSEFTVRLPIADPDADHPNKP